MRERKERVNYDIKALNLGTAKIPVPLIKRVIFRAKKVKLYFEHIELLDEKIISTMYSTNFINGKYIYGYMNFFILENKYRKTSPKLCLRGKA